MAGLLGGGVGLVLWLSWVGWLTWAGNVDRGSAAKSNDKHDLLSGAFFQGLAALDVDENELAISAFAKVVEVAPEEPALWGNLAVAHLRAGNFAEARAAGARAAKIAPADRQILLLQAELARHTGDTAMAIEHYRVVHERWPDNMAATHALASLLQSRNDESASHQRRALLADMLARSPENLPVLCEQARLAANGSDQQLVGDSLAALGRYAADWPPLANEIWNSAVRAADQQNSHDVVAAIRSLENVLKRDPRYQRDLQQLGVVPAVIGTPIRDFVVMSLSRHRIASPDRNLTFEVLAAPSRTGRSRRILAYEQPGELPPLMIGGTDGGVFVNDGPILATGPFAAESDSRARIAVADLDGDYQLDVAISTSGGVQLLRGNGSGTFTEPTSIPGSMAGARTRLWAMDVESDGDLDLIFSDENKPLVWRRNIGKLAFAPPETICSAVAVRDLRYADLDHDGDVDLATIDGAGQCGVWWNERFGRYVAAPMPNIRSVAVLAVGDVDRDGAMDLVVLTHVGDIQRINWELVNRTWQQATLVAGEGLRKAAAIPDEITAGQAFLELADFDNNGSVDLVASLFGTTRVWLADEAGKFEQASKSALESFTVSSVVDLDQDGRLDVVGWTAEGTRFAFNRGKADYGWQIIQPSANMLAGDQRINSFGIGGRMDIRSGGLAQAAVIQSPRVHFGLGARAQVDVARIIWPNGVLQAEFNLHARESIVARQRLKGSCPWVFAFDGQQFQFIKDFLWRSPLGLRINAQDTAGVAQTEDWIKIPGSSLAVVAGRYQLRITAELWETHFFDAIALLAVDHSADCELLVDERFVPNSPPTNQLLLVSPSRPMSSVVNHRGELQAEAVRHTDRNYADRFLLGTYQGIAEEHWLEFTLPEEVDARREALIVGHGWVYPTDSSLNVAIAQVGVQPRGLSLEQWVNGEWHLLDGNVGFPAGKCKDMALPLPTGSLHASRRFRLRTNMEVYWDSLGWSYALPNIVPRPRRLPLQVAELRERGYSQLLPVHRRRPDTPIYRVTGTAPRWFDLEGYYTQFGDVRELLTAVDGRYVIMNAGDELVLEFAALPALPADQRRDFVLIGDGWVKDGDLNTAHSRWVQPLPSHEDSQYQNVLVPLEFDPVYLCHGDDWRRYHTRYVAPSHVSRQLWTPEQ